MKAILTSLPLLFVLSVSSAQNETKTEKVTVLKSLTGFFEGLSSADIPAMRSYCTDDVIILEHGLIWNFDTLASKITGRKRPDDYKRENKLDFLEIDIKDDVAWLYYWNEASITANKKNTKVKWLESAVLRKQKNEWKIQLLHSTKMELPD